MKTKICATGKKGFEEIEELGRKMGFEVDRENPDILCILGGDGSLLRGSNKYPNAKLLLFRKESVGVLAESEERDEEKCLEKIKTNDYSIESFKKIEMKYKENSYKGLNDVWFFRNHQGADRFKVYREGKDIYGGELFGDGCLAATSLGSTGYNYNLGGEVLKLNEKNYAFTPMNSGLIEEREITENGRTVPKEVNGMKIPDDEAILVKILRDSENELIYDGLTEFVEEVYFKKGDEVIFQPSEDEVEFIRFEK